MDNKAGNNQIAYAEVIASFDDVTDEFIFGDNDLELAQSLVFRSQRAHEATSPADAGAHPVHDTAEALA